MTAVLRCRHDESAFEVQVAARVGLRDADGAEVAVIAVSTTSGWSSSRPLPVQEDTAETFTLAIGCLEPLSQAANALRSGCHALNLDASVSIAERLEFNRRAVFGIADLPDMGSSTASPLNPYALVGIAGAEAAEWEALGVPASLAAHWASRQLLPGKARWWIRWEFALDDALAWLDADIDAPDARRFVTHGFPTPEHVKRFQDDTEIHPYDLAHLVGVVSRDEMETWLDAI